MTAMLARPFASHRLPSPAPRTMLRIVLVVVALLGRRSMTRGARPRADALGNRHSSGRCDQEGHSLHRR